MKGNLGELNKRLMNVKNMYEKVDMVVDALPDAIPEDVRKFIKEKIVGDEALKELIKDIESRRPARLFMLGRTGSGKSSLINAMRGSYLAEVSNIKSCTINDLYMLSDDAGNDIMQIMDTRGFAESKAMNNISAEQQLEEDLIKFKPDLILFVTVCSQRDHVDQDAALLKKLEDKYKKMTGLHVPVIVVVNKCDIMPPMKGSENGQYTQDKISNIYAFVSEIESIIEAEHLIYRAIIPVCSTIDWEKDVSQINKLSHHERSQLQMVYDGRWNIEKLKETCLTAITDEDAKKCFKQAIMVDKVVKDTALRMAQIFGGISAGVAAASLPISDIYILTTIQAVLVVLIAYISGEDLTVSEAVKFVFNIGGVVGNAFVLRAIVQESTKLLQSLYKTSTFINAIVAGQGTMTVGNAAIRYYINGDDDVIAKKQNDVAQFIFDHSKKAFDMTGDAVQNVKNAGIKTGKNIQDFSKKTGQAVNDASHQLVKNMVHVGNNFGKAAGNAGEYVARNAQQVKQNASESAKDLGDAIAHGVHGVVGNLKKKK